MAEISEMTKITEEMLVCEVLEMDDALEEVFMKHDLNCAGCPGASMETISEAASGHGADLGKLLEDLNRFFMEK